MCIDWLTEITGIAGLLGHPLGGAVPGAGLLGGDGRVGHQVHGGAYDPGAVAGEHHGAVHLAQLPQPGRGELDVQREAAGAHRLHHLVVAEHDQRAGAATQDPFQPVAQRGAGRHQRRGWPATGHSVDPAVGTARGTVLPVVTVGRHPDSLGTVRGRGALADGLGPATCDSAECPRRHCSAVRDVGTSTPASRPAATGRGRAAPGGTSA